MTIQPNLPISSGTSAISSPKKSSISPEGKSTPEPSTPQESVSITVDSTVQDVNKHKETKGKGSSAKDQPLDDTTSQSSEGKTVKVNVYQQDPFVAKPILMEIPANEINKDLTSPRVVTEDLRPLAKPDAEGNFLMPHLSDGLNQVNAHVITNQTLHLLEGYRGSSIDWAVGKQMSVTPHKQEGRNAYYSRWGGGTNFFYSSSPGLGRVMNTAASADVVSHETGHALLDGLRPGYFGTHDDETGAFHEAFGDCMATLYALSQKENRSLFIEQTGGDMTKHNVFSDLAEEFGAARVLDNSDPADDHKTWLRTSINDFTYKPPSELPPGRGSDTELGREVHSFARLFASAFYDSVGAIYEQARSEGQSIEDALVTAEQINGPALARSVESASTSRATFKQIALGMIASEKANGGKYADAMTEAFSKRKIITPADVKAYEQDQAQLPNVHLPEGGLTTGALSKANAVDFLEANADKLGLPKGLAMVPERASVNGKGETFLSYRYEKEVPVTVAGLDDKVTNVQGGVSLVFDKDGKLINRDITLIDKDTVSREMKGIANMYEQHAIIDKAALGLFKSSNTDESIFKSAIDGNKIVRIPISGCDN